MLRDHALQPHQTSVAEQVRGQSRPARSRSGRYRPHAAPAAVRGWPCASTAAGRGDPRHRSPGCRRRRTRPRHIEDEGGVAVTQRMAAAWLRWFPRSAGLHGDGAHPRRGLGQRRAQAIPAPRPRLLEALRDDPDVKAALADGAVLAVVPLVFNSGKGTKANIFARCRHAAGDRRGGSSAWADPFAHLCVENLDHSL